MTYRIGLGALAVSSYPGCRLYIDSHLGSYDAAELDGLEISGDVLARPTREAIAERIQAIDDPHIELLVTAEGQQLLMDVMQEILDSQQQVTLTIKLPRDSGVEANVLSPLPLRPRGDEKIDQPPEEGIEVFLCYCSADRKRAREIYQHLVAAGARVWFDAEKLLPGHDWQYEIEAALRRCDAVVICLSRYAIDKVGFVQREIRHALNYAEEQPYGSIFIIPVRLDDSKMPSQLQRWQWVELDSADGVTALKLSIQARAAQVQRRRSIPRTGA